MARDYIAEGARVRTGLPLDIDDPQRARAVGLKLQPPPQPALKNLDPLHRIAEAWVAPIKAIENMEFVGSPRRTGDGIDRRHAAAGMRRQDETVDIHRRRCSRGRVPAQNQIRLGSRMRAQHRRLGQIRLARGDALAGYSYLAKRVWILRHWFDTAPLFQSRRPGESRDDG